MDKRIILAEKDMPQRWYNIIPDLPKPPAPPLNPKTMKPAGPEDFTPIFPMELIKQEMSGESWIEIPDELRKILTTWRPTPLVRAFGLEKALKTKARIYFKDESKSPAGSHKTNTSVAQA
jgi:tryptophan synthase beta chain